MMEKNCACVESSQIYSYKPEIKIRSSSQCINNCNNNFCHLHGPSGFMGKTGLRGPKGQQGDTGLNGPKGDTGDKGSIGLEGELGVSGSQGKMGEKGQCGGICLNSEIINGDGII